MAKKLLLRADDLGYCKGINYGIADCVKSDVIRNVGIMINMDDVEHGLQLIDIENVCLGLHTNICGGRPVSNAGDIPSMVDENGCFKLSEYYRGQRADRVSMEEAEIEIEAQIHKFIHLTGRRPDYIDYHAAGSPFYIKALKKAAQKYNITYSPLPDNFDLPVSIGQSNVLLLSGSKEDVPPFEILKAAVRSCDKFPYLIVYHPGYLDSYILAHSSLTHKRILEMDMLCSNEAINYLKDRNVDLITYNQL